MRVKRSRNNRSYWILASPFAVAFCMLMVIGTMFGELGEMGWRAMNRWEPR